MQSTLATAMTRVSNKTKALQVVPPRLVLRLQRSVVQVRCTKEDGQSEQPPPVTAATLTLTVTSTDPFSSSSRAQGEHLI